MAESNKWSLTGKVALITGGGTGIGKAIGKRFVDAGAKVVIAGRTRSTIETVAETIKCDAIAADVSRESDVQALFQQIVAKHGRLDILVNNAGVPGPINGIADMDIAAWDECVQINLRGAMLCLKEAARLMTAQRSGSIVNMSS